MTFSDLIARVDALPAGSAYAEPAAWYLDIDGVLNLWNRPPRHGWPRYAHQVVPMGEGLAQEVCYAPALVELLNLLHAKHIVSFRWLTTWEHDAHKLFAPKIGLNVGQWVAAEDDGDGRSWWKLRAFSEALSATGTEQLLIWTDDEIDRDFEAQRVTAFLHPEQALVICPNRHNGLSPSEFEAILFAIEQAIERRQVSA